MKVAFGVFIGCELARVRLLLTDTQFKRYCEILAIRHGRALAYIDAYFDWQTKNPNVVPTGVIE